MRKVENLNELMANTKLLDKYLNSKIDPEYSFALNLIKKGTCFVVIREQNIYKFYPSRFIGYAENSIDFHMNNSNKDGRETNLFISNILKSNPIQSNILENLYQEYCKLLGFVANIKGSFGVERKYWEI